MQARCLFAMVVVALWIGGIQSADAIEPKQYQSKEELLRDYEPASKRLLTSYANVSIEAERAFTEAPGSATVRQRIVFHANGPLLRLDINYLDGGELVQRINVVGQERAFLATEPTANGKLVLNELTPDANSIREMAVLDAPVVVAATNFYETTILHWLTSPDVRVLKIERDNVNSREVLKVWTGAGWENNAPIRTDWILLDPDAQWVCRGYCLGYSYRGKTYPDKSAQMSAFEYQGEVNGVPAIGSAEYWLDDHGQKMKLQQWTVTRVERSELPVAEFTLTAVGLPEIEESVSRIRYYVIGAFVIALAMFLAFWIRNRHVVSKQT